MNALPQTRTPAAPDTRPDAQASSIDLDTQLLLGRLAAQHEQLRCLTAEGGHDIETLRKAGVLLRRAQQLVLTRGPAPDESQRELALERASTLLDDCALQLAHMFERAGHDVIAWYD